MGWEHVRPPGWALSSAAGSTRPDPPSPRRERLVHELDTTGELLVDLGSDQTSCHNPFNGGYYPVQLGFAEAQSLMASDPTAFKSLVQERWCWTGLPAQGMGAHTACWGCGRRGSGLRLVLPQPAVWPVPDP